MFWETIRHVPAVFIWITIGLCLSGWVLAFFGNEKKLPDRVTPSAWPVVVSAVTIAIGFCGQEIYAGKPIVVAAYACIIMWAASTLRYAYNPLGPLDRLANWLIAKEDTRFLAKVILPQIPVAELKMREANLASDGKVTWGDLVGHLAKFTRATPVLLESPRIPLTLFLGYFFLAVVSSVTLFGVILHNTGTVVSSAPISQFLLASIMRFTGSDVNEILGASKANPWVLATEGVAAFFYVVVALLAFSITSGKSSENFRRKVELILKREWDALAEAAPDAIVNAQIEQDRSDSSPKGT